MEYADSDDLFKCIKSAKFSEKETIKLFTQMILGVAKLHHHQIIHRDIKPANIFLLGKRTGGIIQLGDFGSAKSMEDFDSMMGEMTIDTGTYFYFSPEKFKGNYKFPSDIWALGIVLYNMLT
jgi:serine/threonine protein kinase